MDVPYGEGAYEQDVSHVFKALGKLLEDSEAATLRGDFNTATSKFVEAKQFCQKMSRGVSYD